MPAKGWKGKLLTRTERDALFPSYVTGGVYTSDGKVQCVKAIFGTKAVYNNQDMGTMIQYQRSPISAVHSIMMNNVGQTTRVIVVQDRKDYDRGEYTIVDYNENNTFFLLKKVPEKPAQGTLHHFFKKRA
jgi:hypothetical protein